MWCMWLARSIPASDVETIKTELVLADLATIEKAKPRLEKDAKRGKDAAKKLDGRAEG